MAAIQQVSIEEGAERLRDRFLNEYADSDEIDQRDIKRVRNCQLYVTKFLVHKFEAEEAAYDMMVYALKWRHTYGIHDLSYSNLDDSLIDSGLAYHHGSDRDNNTLVILNCHLHKKDSKRLPELEKFFIFAVESHARRYPDKKITLIFNMSQCGLSNMDLDFIKIIINCFKFYFPNMLGYMLVFEMPWLLQAAWKIIKSWLSEVAVRKIKFVTKSDITDYISPEQLLSVFGGYDDWKYNAETYREELRKESGLIWVQDPLGLPPPYKDDKDESKNDSGRQVRFAPGQPPSNQSRFGADEDNEFYNRHMSLDPQLLRGTVASPGYRRRMVSRLITQQSSHERMRHASSIDYGDLPSHALSRKPPKYVLISPSDELLFSGQTDQDLYCTIILTNLSDQPLAYKIKTTAPRRYKVRPNLNIIDAQSKASIQVQLVLGGNIEAITQDKFLIQTYQFEVGTTPPDSTQLTNFWKDLSALSFHEYRLKCCYSAESKEVSTIKPSLEPIKKEHIPPTLIRKLDRLATELNEIRQTMNYIKYIAMVTLLLVLFILCVLLVK